MMIIQILQKHKANLQKSVPSLPNRLHYIILRTHSPCNLRILRLGYIGYT